MDSRALSAVLGITENRSRILAVIVAMVRDFDVAEELFQETVTEILNSEEQFDPTRRFLPWACGVARNVVRQHWKRQGRAPAGGSRELIADLALVSVEGEEDAWARERKALRVCLRKLPDRMQRLLLLRYGHNVKGRELAESASVRVGSIRTTLARLRSRLREGIEANTARD